MLQLAGFGHVHEQVFQQHLGLRQVVCSLLLVEELLVLFIVLFVLHRSSRSLRNDTEFSSHSLSPWSMWRGSHRIQQLLRFQDVLLYLIGILLHTSDDQGQLTDLGPETHTHNMVKPES